MCTAPVAVEDHARLRVAGGQGVAQRRGGQLSAQMIGEGIADDAAGGDVDDGGHSVESDSSGPTDASHLRSSAVTSERGFRACDLGKRNPAPKGTRSPRRVDDSPARFHVTNRYSHPSQVPT
jgi:hypothetical protein